MRRFAELVITAIAILAASTQFVFAESQPASSGDARVKAALDKLGWKYQVDQDGDYKLLMKVGGRSQVVYILSKTETLGYPSFITLGRRKYRIHAEGTTMLPTQEPIEQSNQVRKPSF